MVLQNSAQLRSRVAEIEERRLAAPVRWIIPRLLVFISHIVELAVGIFFALLLSSALLVSGGSHA